jgi:hypothetical protein
LSIEETRFESAGLFVMNNALPCLALPDSGPTSSAETFQYFFKSVMLKASPVSQRPSDKKIL